MANTREYLILSELAYMDVNFEDWNDSIDNVSNINYEDIFNNDLSDHKITGLTYAEFNNTYNTSIQAMSDWKVVNYENKNQKLNDEEPTGFCGTAFQKTNPDGTTEIVFAFRGTEPDMVADGTKLPQDFLTDYALAVKGEAAGAVNQFKDAETFFKETMENMYRSEHNESLDGFNLKQYALAKNVTFAGHSLGGGLAQYMTYYTKDYKTGGLEAVTFNGVGIGQVA